MLEHSDVLKAFASRADLAGKTVTNYVEFKFFTGLRTSASFGLHWRDVDLAGKTQRRMVSAAIGTVFVQHSADTARAQWRSVADQLRGRFPKLGALMDKAESDEWSLTRRCMQLEGLQSLSDTIPTRLSAAAR